MEKIKKYYKTYKYGIYLFIACLVVKLSTNIISKGEYNKYITEKQMSDDCQSGWLDENTKVCIKAKKEKEIEDSKIEDNKSSDEIKKIVLPSKAIYDYVLSLASILEILFIGFMGFEMGGQFKKEKFKQLWKSWDLFLIAVLLELLLNYLYISSNKLFLSTDFLRFTFEMIILLVTFVLGRKIK